MDVDEAIDRVGGFGPFQVQICVINFFKEIVGAFQMIGLVFIALVPERVDCSNGEIVYSSYYTIVNEWKLICSKGYFVDLIQSVYMVGVLVGAVLFGPMSDIYGRRRVLFVCFLGQCIVSSLSAFPKSFPVFVGLRCIVGFFSQGVSLSSFTLLLELVSSSHRAAVGIFTQICFAVGIALLAFCAAGFQSWRQLTLALGLAGFLLTPCAVLVPESPRWLVSRGRVLEADLVLRNIAQRNGRNTDKIPTLMVGEAPEKEEPRESLMSVLRHRQLRTWTIVNLLSWAVNSGVYYGLTLIAGKFGSNAHISVAFSGLIEIPSYLLAPWLMRRFGRKRSLIGFMIAAGICCAAIVPTPKSYSSVAIILATAGKLFISGSFAIAYIHTMEIYPTSVRTAALGLACMSSRIGGILAPFLLMLGGPDSHSTFAFFAVLTFISGTFNCKLPETNKRAMLQMIADVDDLPEGVASIKESKNKNSTQA